MPIFNGLNPTQTTTVTRDIAHARDFAMILSAMAASGGSRDYNYGLRPAVARLLYEAFCISPTQPDPDQVDRVKNVFLGFEGRMRGPTFTFVSARPQPGVIEFDAFVDRTKPNTIFLRREYFAKTADERALTLIHEYVHMAFPNNPGDGHPGGQQISFGRAVMGIPFVDASRNPYCYQYCAGNVGGIWIFDVSSERRAKTFERNTYGIGIMSTGIHTGANGPFREACFRT